MAKGRTRGKLNVEFISNERTRNSTFLKRKDSLTKKIYELSTLCGIDACMIAYGPKHGKPFTWPENEEKVRRVLTRYNEHKEKGETVKRSMDLASYINNQKQKIEHDIARLRRQNEELENSAKKKLVESLNGEQLKKLSCELDSKLKLIKERIVSRKEDIGSQEEKGVFDYSDSSVVEQSQFFNMPAKTAFHGQTWQNVHPIHIHADAQPLSYNRFMTDPMPVTSNNAFAINQVYLDQMSGKFAVQNPHFQCQGLMLPQSNGFEYVNQESPVISSSSDNFSSDNFSSNTQATSSPYVFPYQQPYIVTEMHDQLSESQTWMWNLRN